MQEVSVSTQQFLSPAPSFSVLSYAPAWVVYGPQSLQQCTCSGMGLSTAIVPWGKYLLCHRAPPRPLTLLFPLFFPPPLHSLVVSMFPPLGIFCLSLNMLSQRYHQLGWWAQLWPVMGPFQRQLEVAVSGTGQPLASSCRGHACSPPAAKTLPFTSNIASKGWAFVALAQKYASYKLSKCISLCLILREVSTGLSIHF